MLVLLVAMFVQSEASGAIVPLLRLVLIDIVCGSSGSGTSYMKWLDPWTQPLAYPTREWTNSFKKCILIENLCRRSGREPSLRSRGELLVRSLSVMPIGNRKLGIRAMYVAHNWFYRCESTNHREVWSSESSGKSWYERGALTCYLVALMGSGQQRCHYERAKPFEKDPREDKSCL